MKKLLLFFIFSGSLDSFSQNKNDTTDLGMGVYMIRHKDSLVGLYRYAKPDTIRAELLVTYTTRRWGIAHSRDGYVVRKDGKVIRFLTDEKKRFPPNTKFWGWIKPEERVLP